MSATANFLAVDLGASNGRIVLARWDGERFDLEELHRFSNEPVNILGTIHWDALRLWSEIKAGLARYAASHSEPLAGIGLDTWGVDFALLDSAGQLLGNPVHYRDARTDGMMEAVFWRVPREKVFEVTGLQFMQLNTLYQITSLVLAGDPQLAAAETLLMTPDLFRYWMTGEKGVEYTIASTSQMLDARRRTWAIDLLETLAIPTGILPAIVPTGTVVAELLSDIAAEAGLSRPAPVIASASHDTAAAVAAVPGLDSRSAYLSSGTWSLIGTETPEPVINERSLALNFTNEGGVGNTIRLLKNITGLWLLQESRRQWQREGHHYGWEDLLAMAEQAQPFRSLIDPDAGDFLGPGDMPAAIRAYCRRTGHAEPESVGAVVRCCLESLALKYRWVLEALENLTGQTIDTLRIVGGGSQNRLLSQFAADACQRVVVTGPVEATALGNVMVQAIATGYLDDVAAGRQAVAASVQQEVFEPRPGPAWDEAYQRFQNLITTTDIAR